MNYLYIEQIANINAQSLREKLYQKYKYCFEHMDNSYIFGTGLLGSFVYQELKKNDIKVQGFIDNDRKKQGKYIEGIKIYNIKDISKESQIIIASLMNWYEIKKQLEELKFTQFFCYEELALALPQFSTYNESFYDLFTTLEKQRDYYGQILLLLGDEKSKQILDSVVAFRITLDIEFTKRAYDMSIVEGNQYFDRIILKSKNDEVFLDGGGYDGDSIRDFLLWNKGIYKKILFFEPDKNMICKAKERLQNVDKIEYFSKALGSNNGTIRYDASGNQTGGGQIKETGDTVVELSTIDSLNEKITLLKLDTEGYEMEILRGAENTIRNCKPRIMLAAYHKAGDIYDICDYILKINPSYEVYMRHYTKVYADTVLYFV